MCNLLPKRTALRSTHQSRKAVHRHYVLGLISTRRLSNPARCRNPHSSVHCNKSHQMHMRLLGHPSLCGTQPRYNSENTERVSGCLLAHARIYVSASVTGNPTRRAPTFRTYHNNNNKPHGANENMKHVSKPPFHITIVPLHREIPVHTSS